MPSTEHNVAQRLPRSLYPFVVFALLVPSLQPANGAAARGGTVSRAEPVRSEGAADAARLAAEIRHAREGATVSEWIAEHPSDLVEPFDAPSRDHDTDGWCVRARQTHELADGSTFERTAYFFDPPPPPGLALPRAAGKQLQGECRLGLVWIEAPSSARATMSRAMTSAFGGPTAQGPVSMRGAGVGYWQDVEAWSSQRPHGVLAAEDERADESPTRGRRARLRLALPAWDRWDERIVTAPAHALGPQVVAGERERTLLEHELAVLAVSVRAIPGVEERSRAAMLALLADHGPSRSVPDLTTPDVVAIFASWTKAARTLEPEARIDALLAADRLMDFVNHNGWTPEPAEGRDTLRVAGARFVHNPLAAGYVYAHSMLEEALELEAPAAAHDRALLREMEIGFDHSGMCDAGRFPFEQVIATGEPLIARSRDPRTRSAAHFLVGDAYATIVALARGAGGEYADPARHADREGDARAKALAHFRAALALDSSSETARSAWQTAWRLAAGLSPVWPRYFCVFD